MTLAYSPSSSWRHLFLSWISWGVCLLGMGLSPSAQAQKPANASAQERPRVDYLKYAFQPDTWKNKKTDTQLDLWQGKEIAFMALPVGLDPSFMESWVNRLDAGWALYRDITGASPHPHNIHEGFPVIAAVPDSSYTCGAGCGYIGATGIELALFYQHDIESVTKEPESMPHYVFYEMGRNFFTFGKRHDAFTTGFAVFMRYVCMDTLKLKDTDMEVRKTIESLESHFRQSELDFMGLFSNSGRHEKSHRIEGKAPSDQPCTYTSAMLRLWKENGENAWLKRFFEELRQCPEVEARGEEGDLQQGWIWFLCASLAAEKDLSQVFIHEWKLPASPQNLALLKKVVWKGKGKAKAKDVFRQLTF